MTQTRVHAKINLRKILVDSIMQDGVQTYGGPGNATVKSESFKLFAALKANYLVNGLNQLRSR